MDLLNPEVQDIVPSVEDKVFKFNSKDNHQIFLEPETLNNEVTYPNGISTSLPTKHNKNFLEQLEGWKSRSTAIWLFN